MSQAEAVQLRRSTGGANLILLWFGMLAAPTAWGLQLSVTYFFVAAACQPTQRNPELALHLSSAVFFVIALAGLAVSLYELAGLPPSAREHGQRARWMAGTGILLSGLFLVMIVFGEVPAIFLRDHCATAHA